MRVIEGVSNGQAVIESFLNATSTPQATFALTSSTDEFRAVHVYDPTTAQLDYTALAYVDAGAVHLELLNESGVQIGTDFVVPGITSFDRLKPTDGERFALAPSTRVELDYTVTDPSGGTEIKGFIYDTATSALNQTLSGGQPQGGDAVQRHLYLGRRQFTRSTAAAAATRSSPRIYRARRPR